MNVVGMTVTVLSSKDPTKQGRSGVVLLETANTLLLGENGKEVRVEKMGTAFMVQESREVVTGDDISGRLEDRLGRKR